MPSLKAVSRKNVFYDGQRWVHREHSPVRPLRHGPEEFSIADDADDNEPSTNVSVSGAEPAANTSRRFVLNTRTALALLTISIVTLFMCIEMQFLPKFLPPAQIDIPRRPVGPGIADTTPLVHWHGLVPDCPGEHFVVADRPVKLRKTADKDSEVVSRLHSGTMVSRTGPCENHNGLVRVPLSVHINGSDTFNNAPKQHANLEVQGWATLTAEHLNGPRFFKQAPD